MAVGDFQAVIDAVLSEDVVLVSHNRATGHFRQHNSAWRAARRGLS